MANVGIFAHCKSRTTSWFWNVQKSGVVYAALITNFHFTCPTLTNIFKNLQTMQHTAYCQNSRRHVSLQQRQKQIQKSKVSQMIDLKLQLQPIPTLKFAFGQVGGATDHNVKLFVTLFDLVGHSEKLKVRGWRERWLRKEVGRKKVGEK